MAWDQAAFEKRMAEREKTGGGEKDIGAGLAGTEHFANQLVFGLTPALQDARTKSAEVGTNANPMAGFGDWIGKQFGLESTPSTPPPPAAPPPTALADQPIGAGPGEFGDLSGTGNVSGQQIKQELKSSEEMHPLAATVGKGAAELAHQAVLAPIMPFAAGGRVGSAIASGATSGALEGGLQGTGHAVGEGKPLDMDTLLDIGKQAAMGGAFGAGGGTIGHGLARLAQPAAARIGTLGKGIADDVRTAFGAGAPTLEKAGAKALPAEAAQVGGMLNANPAQIGAGQKLASEVETLAQRGGQVPELTAEKGVQQGVIGAKQASEGAQLASSTARAEAAGLNKNLSPKVFANSKVGKTADEARKSVAAGLGDDVGKDSPAAWIAAREKLTNDLVSAGETQAPSMRNAIKQIDRFLGKNAPDAAKTVKLGQTVQDTGKVADIVNQPLATAVTAPAKKLGDMTMGDLATKFGTSALGALGGGLGHGSIMGGIVGGLAPLAAKAVATASQKLGTKGAIQLYMKDPKAFMEQYGRATLANRPLGLLSQEGLKGGKQLPLPPALQNFLPYSP